MLGQAKDALTLLGLKRKEMARQAFRVMQVMLATPEITEELRELSRRVRRPATKKAKTPTVAVTPEAPMAAPGK